MPVTMVLLPKSVNYTDMDKVSFFFVCILYGPPPGEKGLSQNETVKRMCFTSSMNGSAENTMD
jgi:hypothetical protein